MVDYLCAAHTRCRVGKQSKFWLATDSSEEDFNFGSRNTDALLRVKGINLGYVTSTGPCMSDPAREYRDNQRRKKSSRELDSGSKSTYNALCRLLLIYDTKYEQLTKRPILLFMLYNLAWNMYASFSADTDSESDHALVHRWLRQNCDYEINGWKLKDYGWFSFWTTPKNYLTGLLDFKARTLTVFDYKHLIQSIAQIVREDMRLVTLESGVLGWADNAVKYGDEIFLFAGCTMPVVLRKTNNNYRLVGRAYVDNAMEGSRWKKNAAQEIFIH